MSSLVLELQRDAMDPKVRVTDLLRKAVAVGKKLRVDGFVKYATNELSGYSTPDTPNYRIVRGELRAHNPYNGWIPVILANAELERALKTRTIQQPISEIEHLCENGDGDGILAINLPQDAINNLFLNTNEYRMGIIPRLTIGHSQLKKILDAVRTEILNLALELEQEGILGEGLTFTPNEVRQATSIQIGQFSGVWGNVNSSNVVVGDYASIHSQLKEAGISQKARNELEQILDAIKSEKSEVRKGAVSRGFEWLKKYGATLGILSETIRNWLTATNII